MTGMVVMRCVIREFTLIMVVQDGFCSSVLRTAGFVRMGRRIMVFIGMFRALPHFMNRHTALVIAFVQSFEPRQGKLFPGRRLFATRRTIARPFGAVHLLAERDGGHGE
jgi:hypothetical protein